MIEKENKNRTDSTRRESKKTPTRRPLHRNHGASIKKKSSSMHKGHRATKKPATDTIKKDSAGRHQPMQKKISSPTSHKKREAKGRQRSGGRKGGMGRRMPMPMIAGHRGKGAVQSSKHIPAPLNDTIRIITLGGVEEIGRNMVAIEYNNEIIIIDCGIQFKEQETPGIDFILANTKYLEERKDKIKGILITHGHLDHTGGIPYILNKIGNPTIYTRNLTALMIKKRQEEFPHLPALDIHIVEKDDTITVGNFPISFFSVTHTIPDAMGIIIKTPYGSIVHTGDLKLDHIDGEPLDSEKKEFAKFEKEDVLLLMADSTNVERPGFSIPEEKVIENIAKIIREAKDRLIIGTFASQIDRISKIIKICEDNGKKVVIDGRSMKTNVEIAKLAGVLEVQKETLITVERMADYPSSKIVALVTGAQGDEFAVLMRVANKNHKYIKINDKDTIVLSSSIIPGNERGVQKLKDNLSRQGAHIIHYQVSDVHSSGHANRDETKWIHNRIKPRFFIPIHGYHYMLRVHKDIAHEVGVPVKNIVLPDNGMIIEIKGGETMSVHKEKAPSGLVLVDGFSIGDIQEVVIRDRQMLAQDGMFVIVVTIDVNTGKLRKSPDLISRGFVYLRESQELLRDTRVLVKKTVEKNIGKSKPINFDFIKNTLTDDVSRFLFKKTNKRPIVIPVILGI